MPIRVGECTTSTVKNRVGRLGGEDFSVGTIVEYANGGGQVSFDSEQAIIDSRIMDRVEICLVSVPEETCPQGDGRGKVYETTNERTGKSWTLPNSAHSCGGA
jgi:hypothetical protein